MRKLFGKNAEILYICLKYFVVRWFKIILLLLVLLASGYTAVMYYFFEEKNSFVVEKEIEFPLDKVFPQFDDLQNLTRWNDYFLSDKDYRYRYFLPYEGEGSSMSYNHTKDKNKYGEVFIRKVKENKSISYELYQERKEVPYKIHVKFFPKGDKTKIVWQVNTPKYPLLLRFKAADSDIESYINNNVTVSIKNLTNLLSGKVDKEVMFSQIKYDSIMIEEQDERLFLGVNVSTSNKKGALFKNIVINHNRVFSYVTKDLSKREDEFGEPVLFTEAGELKNKEVSYFYGVPLSQKVNVSDNNFAFRTIKKSKYYSIYYKGGYEQRTKAIAKLLDKIKKDLLQNGKLEELFVEAPYNENDVVLKLSFPVY